MLVKERSSLNIFLVFVLIPAVVSQIQLGSRISVEGKNFWVSSNGDFAIGFFNRSNKHSVGIHFNSLSIPTSKQIVVWVAGGDVTVGDKSYFELTQDGELILFNSAMGSIAWTSKTGQSSVNSALLSDNGNLVLLNGHKDIVWQSFDTPFDTLLPGQNLSSFQTLRAASRNSMSSYYSLKFSSLGELRLMWESNVVYWTSRTQSPKIAQALLLADGTLQLLGQRSEPVWSVFGEDHNDPGVKFRILRLDVDGNLRIYSWMEALKTWRSVWQAIGNQCNVYATCGLCGICVFNSSGSPVCKCPFTNASESSSKCLVPYRESCKSGSSMVTYEHTLLYGIYSLNETIMYATSSLMCKSLCQEKPLCTAATFTNNGSGQCLMKQTQYISGYSGPTESSISFVKSCSDPIAIFPMTPKSPPSSSQYYPPNKSYKLCVPCVIGVVAGTFVTFLVIQLGVGFYIFKRRNPFRPTAASAYLKSFTMLSYMEIEEITGNFKNQMGPYMFKGVLPNKQPIAVRVVNINNIEERKFRSAASKLGSIHHKNLTKMEGYCCEPGHRYLVYEFSKNGTLGKCLEDPKMCSRLTWKKRMGVITNVARAIFYLHTECREFICHGNLNCETVILDDSLEAKVLEFGLGSVEKINNAGCAEIDVRDFGKMVIALLSGVQNDEAAEWTYQNWLGAQSESIIDKRIEGGVDYDELERSLRLAFWCLQADKRMRPSMGEVVNVLEGASAVDPPPPPFARRCSPVEEEELGSDTE